MTRSELASATRLDPKSITNIVRGLLLREAVAMGGHKKSERGRRVRLIEPRPDRNLAVGLSLESDRIQAVVVNLRGERLWEGETRGLTADADVVGGRLRSTLRNLFRKSDFRREFFWGVGICAPGILDAERRRWKISARMPHLVGTDWKRLIEKASGLTAELEDNSRAAAVGERLFGWGRRHGSFLLVDLDTGVGAAIILEGRLFRGLSGHSGELGHVCVEPDGALCACGKRGCLETVAGLEALTASFNRDIPADRPRADGYRDVLERAEAGDRIAREVLERAARALGVALAGLYNVLDLPICLTGRLMEAGDPFFEATRARFRERCLVDDAEIGRGELDERAPAIGAAGLVQVAALGD